jgi:tRNA A37 threonylcarbamoyladenosine dehydratase
MSFDARTRLLIGDEAADSLAARKVLIFGIGGVGGYVCEALARAGIGTIGIVDNDTVIRQL